MSLTLRTYPGDPLYEVRYNLEGREYFFTFDWSGKEEVYYLKIEDANRNVLLSGLKLVCNWPLLRRYVDSRLPYGELGIVSLTDDDSPPGLYDLGEGARCVLTYFTRAEVLARNELFGP